jgi:hypothetical protein
MSAAGGDLLVSARSYGGRPPSGPLIILSGTLVMQMAL